MDGPGRRLRLHLESHLRKVTNANFNLSGCEPKPDAKRKRGGAQPQERAQPSIKKGGAMFEFVSEHQFWAAVVIYWIFSAAVSSIYG